MRRDNTLVNIYECSQNLKTEVLRYKSSLRYAISMYVCLRKKKVKKSKRIRFNHLVNQNLIRHKMQTKSCGGEYQKNRG